MSVDAPPEITPNVQVGAGVTTGAMLQARVTLFTLKPPLGVIVAVDWADPPGATDAGDKAVAEMVKPWKVAVTA